MCTIYTNIILCYSYFIIRTKLNSSTFKCDCVITSLITIFCSHTLYDIHTYDTYINQLLCSCKQVKQLSEDEVLLSVAPPKLVHSGPVKVR